MLLRNAVRSEAALLSALALRSKAYWGYDPPFLEACRDELTYRPARIDDARFRFVVADIDGAVAGFYALEHSGDRAFELEALFVEPGYIGTGIGRALIEDAKRAVHAAGGTRLVIQGDPNAAAFYTAAGARPIGSRPSASIPGRDLPLYEITIGRSDL